MEAFHRRGDFGLTEIDPGGGDGGLRGGDPALSGLAVLHRVLVVLLVDRAVLEQRRVGIDVLLRLEQLRQLRKLLLLSLG